jgi:hypothetical protein
MNSVGLSDSMAELGQPSTLEALRIPIATGRHGRAAPFLRDDHEQLGISGSTPPGYDALR